MGKQTVSVTITGDARQLRRAFNQAERDAAGFAKKAKGFGSSIRSSLTMWAPIAGAAIVGFGVHAINVASDVEEAGNKIDVVFGKSAKVVKAFGEDAADSMGMSQREYLQFAGRIGALVKPMGATEDQAAEMSTTLTQLAGDLGSFHNVSTEEALTAIASALSGEMEPMKRFGVVLNDSTLKAKALEMGLWSGKGTLDAYAKSQAAYALIMDQTTDAQGDFIRTQDSTANKTKIMQAKFEDLTAELGEKLLPIANTVLDGLISALDSATVWWDGPGKAWLADFQAGLEAISAWWDESGEPVFLRFQDGLDRLSTGWDQLTDRFGNFTTRFWDGWNNEVFPGLRDFFGMFVKLWDAAFKLGEISMGVFTAIHNIAHSVVTSIGSMIGWLLDKVKTVADKLGGLGEVAGALGGPVGAAFGFGRGLLGFDTGGVVPGAVGAPRLAVVHGGETVLPTHKQDFSGMGGTQTIQLVVDGKTLAEVVAPQLAKDRRAHTGSRRVG